jgi:hypothetical protein
MSRWLSPLAQLGVVVPWVSHTELLISRSLEVRDSQDYSLLLLLRHLLPRRMQVCAWAPSSYAQPVAPLALPLPLVPHVMLKVKLVELGLQLQFAKL